MLVAVYEIKLSLVHSQGALPIKLCTRKLLHAPSQYIAIINRSKIVHTPGAHLLKSCTRPWNCARRVQGAPLISDTACRVCEGGTRGVVGFRVPEK